MLSHLEIKNLTKTFGTKSIYENLSFSFTTGCYAIFGPNGIGKSVLMEILAGVSIQDKGSVYLNNIGDNTALAYKKELNYIPSVPSFFPAATGNDFIKFISSLKESKDHLASINHHINGYFLSEHLNTRFSDMSLGTQKKLFLTTLAMGRNSLIVMDEPTNALDSASKNFLAKIITGLAHKAIVIISTHDHDLLAHVEHTAIRLKDSPITKIHVSMSVETEKSIL